MTPKLVLVIKAQRRIRYLVDSGHVVVLVVLSAFDGLLSRGSNVGSFSRMFGS